MSPTKTRFLALAIALLAMPLAAFSEDAPSVSDAPAPEEPDAVEPQAEEPVAEEPEAEEPAAEEPAAEEPEPESYASPELESEGAEIEPFVPGMEEPDPLADDEERWAEDYADTSEYEDLPDGEPFAAGDMEASLFLGGYGSDEEFYLGVGGSFAYYVVNRLAPGLDLQYAHIFSDYDYPESLTTLPFLKFVILRSDRFAPYLVITGGREFQWGGESPIGSWIVGGGVGAHIGIGSRFSIKVQVLALHYWHDKTRVRGCRDEDALTDLLGDKRCNDGSLDPVAAGEEPVGDILTDSDGNQYICQGTCPSDRADKDRDWLFPLVTLGLALSF